MVIDAKIGRSEVSYILMAIPTILISWYLGFPRGYLASFIGLSVGVFVLSIFNDEILRERKIWKEYIIGMLALIVVVIMGYFGSGAVYVTLIDLYYVLIGLTVFEIGLLVSCRFFDDSQPMNSNRNVAAMCLATCIMMILSYVLFIVMDIRVVH